VRRGAAAELPTRRLFFAWRLKNIGYKRWYLSDASFLTGVRCVASEGCPLAVFRRTDAMDTPNF
jgi:hypothetical protein